MAAKAQCEPLPAPAPAPAEDGLAADGVLEVPLLKTAAPALAASELNPSDAGANLNPNGSTVVVVMGIGKDLRD